MKQTKTYVSKSHIPVRYHLYTSDLLLRNKGVIQIHHSVGEHADLYENFALFLVSKGFVVVVGDTLGHGKSLIDFEQGFYGYKDVSSILMEDMKHLVDIIKRTYGDIPYFMMGFGFGSTLVRKFASCYGDYIDGMVLIGPQTKVYNSFVKKSILEILSLMYGPLHRSKFYYGLINKSPNKRLKLSEDGLCWLSSDEKQREDLLKDPMTHFIYTTKGYKDMVSLVEEVNKKEIYEHTPKHLLIFIGVGQQDSLCDHPTQIEQEYKNQGLEVDLHYFENRRHAVIFEANKQEVYYQIYNWLNEHIYM